MNRPRIVVLPSVDHTPGCPDGTLMFLEAAGGKDDWIRINIVNQHKGGTVTMLTRIGDMKIALADLEEEIAAAQADLTKEAV